MHVFGFVFPYLCTRVSLKNKKFRYDLAILHRATKTNLSTKSAKLSPSQLFPFLGLKMHQIDYLSDSGCYIIDSHRVGTQLGHIVGHIVGHFVSAKMAKNYNMVKMATNKMALRLAKCGI